MLDAHHVTRQTRPKGSLLGRSLGLGLLAVVLVRAFQLSGSWPLPLGLAVVVGLVWTWARRPSAQLRRFVAEPLESVELILEAVRQKRNLPGLDSGSNGVVVLARVAGSSSWAVLEGFVARSDLPLLPTGQSLPAWTSPSGEVLLQRPVPGLRLGKLIDDPTPPEEPPEMDTAPDGTPVAFRAARSALGGSLMQMVAGSFFLPCMGAVGFDPTGEDILSGCAELLGLGESAVFPLQVGGLLLSMLFIPWLWWRWLGSRRHDRAWKDALERGDGRLRWARRVARSHQGEGPSYDHVWVPTDDGRLLYGSLMAVAPPRRRGASLEERKAALARHMDPWIAVWTFGDDRFILNVQQGQRGLVWRGVGCLSDADEPV